MTDHHAVNMSGTVYKRCSVITNRLILIKEMLDLFFGFYILNLISEKYYHIPVQLNFHAERCFAPLNMEIVNGGL